MKHFIASLLIGFFIGNANAVLSPTRVIDANKTNGVFTFRNLVNNDGFEKGSRGWTASGGTFTVTTTTSDVGDGSRAGSWDSNGASQTLTSTAVAIPAGDYGANYEVGANLKCASGSCTHLIQAFDGTNVIASQTITSSLTYARTALNFVAPGSGNISARITSVAADEPNLFIDDVYLGRARNVGSVAQADLVGTVRITGCASNWSSTSSSYGDFSTQTGCSYAVTGTGISAPATNIPGFTISGQPGKYVFVYTGRSTVATTASNVQARMTDGTNVSLEEPSINIGSNAGQDIVPVLDFSFTANQPLVNSVWRIQTKSSASTANGLYGTTSFPGVFKIYRYPLSSEISYRPEQGPQTYGIRWAETSSCSWNGTSASYASFAADADCPTPTTYGNVTVPGTKLFNGTFNNVLPGEYEVVFNGIALTDASTNCSYQLWDGTNSIAETNGFNERGASTLIGRVIYETLANRVIELRYKRVSGSGACRVDAQANAVQLQMKPIKPSVIAPNLVGSVTSLSTGSLRVETARITNNGSSCAVADSSSSWITAGSRSGGVCASTATSGVFSSAPICTCTVEHTATSAGECSFDSPITATSLTNVTRDSAGTQVDRTRNIICVGPRGSL